MVSPDRPPKNALNAFLRQVYNRVGFTRFYNFILWFICSGYFFGFLLARVAFMNINIFCAVPGRKDLSAAPGECVMYIEGHYWIGIQLHLIALFPAGILALLQFIPVIRHKYITFHRINGYFAIAFIFTSIAGALMIARQAFGGTLATQTGVGTLSIMSVLAITLAYVNIKRLQIEEHRKWMMRAWIWMGSVITVRIIMKAFYPILTNLGNYYYAMPCKKIVGLFDEYQIPVQAVPALYPDCLSYLNGTVPNQHTTVHADGNGRPEEAAAVLDIMFGASIWLAIVLHVVGVEIYLHLTPREHARLRLVSYERQMELGFTSPGNAGLTAERLGDAEPFVPATKEHHNSNTNVRLVEHRTEDGESCN